MMSGEGVSDSLRSLLLPHVEPLRARALRLVHNRWDAADLVHDTVERALRHRPTVTDATSLRHWLLRVMYNLFIDRQRRRTREADLANFDLAELPAPAPYIPRPWDRVSDTQVKWAMGRVGSPFDAVLRLRHQEGRSYREISELLAIPEATVGTRLLRARRKIHALLTHAAGDA